MKRITLRQLTVLVVVLCGIGAFVSQLSAQSFYGSVVGTVLDNSGAIVPGATITITNKATNEKHTTTSNGTGEFTFVNLVPATYSIQVEMANFKRYVRDAVAVAVNTTSRVEAKLEVGAITETVEVNTAQVLLQTDSGTVSNKVEAQQVQELPLNGRNMMQLLNITPGVIPGSAVEQGSTLAQNNGTSTNPLSWGGGSSAYTINGGDNEEYLNGAPINVLQGSNIGLMPTADSIQEFNIDTSVGGAEQGRATGGIINETTKSGTNNLHFTAYEYFRNADLNANNFFNKRAGIGRPKFNQNLYGFNLGLPIKKNKIFFFGSYEVNNSLTAAPTATNEPTNGNSFSGGLPGGGSDIYDGIFTRQIADPTGKCPSIAGPLSGPNGPNVHGIYHDTAAGTWTLGQGCWDPTSTILRTFWAAQPNSNATNTNYIVNMPAGDVAPEMNARVDINISQKQRLFFHTAWWAPLDKPLIPYPSPNVASALPGGKPWGMGTAVGGFNSNLYILGDTYTLSPKTVLDIRAEYLRFRYNMIPKVNNFDLGGLGGNWAQFNSYLPNGNHWLPAPNFNAGGSVHNLAPTGIGFTNNASGGGFSNNGQGQIWDNYGLNGAITHVFGHHSIKAGFEARLMDMEVLPSGFTAGNPTFGIKYSNVGCAGTNCGDEWAEFLMGDFVSANFSGSYGGTEFNWYQAYFVQDTFQATRKLTLNLGARWELPGGLMEKNDSTLVFLPYATDPYTLTYGTETLVNTPVYPSRSIFPIKHNMINPRVGFAYRLDDKTVIRGGYGITTQAVDEDGGGNGAPGTAVNSQQLAWTNPTGTGQLPTATLSNPVPNVASVYVAAPRRTPNFLQKLATAAQGAGGTALNGFWQNEPLPYVQQYNFAVQRAIGNSFQITASYVGAHAVKLRAGGSIDQIPASAYAVTNTGITTNAALGNTSPTQIAVATTGPWAGAQLGWKTGSSTTANNGSGVFCSPNNAFCNTNWLVGKSLRPYPNYSNATIGNLAYGNQRYNALQVSSQWRIRSGGLIGGAFTWAKTIGDAIGGAANSQDNYNHHADRTVSGVPMRLAINANYPLPFGQGQKFLNSQNGFVTRVVSGWALNDITSFQHGGYLSIGNNTNNQLQQQYGAGNTRANYVSDGSVKIGANTFNCNSNKNVALSKFDRLNEWFNVGCFQYPGDYAFGNENQNDPKLFAAGIQNWDLSLLKTTKITEKYNLQFRVETFNTFNHFQPAAPNTQVGNGSIGKVTTQANNPRQVQLSLRVSY
jgi:hypothetical protein